MLLEHDDLKQNGSIDIDQMKLIAEYRYLIALKVIKEKNMLHEMQKEMFKIALFSCFGYFLTFMFELIYRYYYEGVMMLFNWSFFIVTLVFLAFPNCFLYLSYLNVVKSKRNLDFVNKGCNEWKWILDQTKLQPLMNSKEMIQLQKRFQMCQSVYKFVKDTKDEEVINELV